jgi:hypothetical protein
MSMSMWVVLEHGEIPESLDAGYGVGKSLAGFLDELDDTARKLGLSPLGGFVVDYAEQTEELFADEDVEIDDIKAAIGNLGSEGPWYDPDEGLRTANGLFRHFQGSPDGETESNEGVLESLRYLVPELEYAKQQGSRFHFGVEY